VQKSSPLIALAQFDPDCFSYVLSFFRNASEAFYGTGTTLGLFAAQQHLLDGSPTSDFGPATSQNPLLTKQAIIVLREELEYFSIPPKDGKISTDTNGINEPLIEIKRQCGGYLMEKRNIFTALQRNVNKENNVAEQHLIDMLCMRYVSCLFYPDHLWRHTKRTSLSKVASIATTSGASVPWSLHDVAYRQ
jgi:hypothetical protein